MPIGWQTDGYYYGQGRNSSFEAINDSMPHVPGSTKLLETTFGNSTGRLDNFNLALKLNADSKMNRYQDASTNHNKNHRNIAYYDDHCNNGDSFDANRLGKRFIDKIYYHGDPTGWTYARGSLVDHHDNYCEERQAIVNDEALQGLDVGGYNGFTGGGEIYGEDLLGSGIYIDGDGADLCLRDFENQYSPICIDAMDDKELFKSNEEQKPTDRDDDIDKRGSKIVRMNDSRILGIYGTYKRDIIENNNVARSKNTFDDIVERPVAYWAGIEASSKEKTQYYCNEKENINNINFQRTEENKPKIISNLIKETFRSPRNKLQVFDNNQEWKPRHDDSSRPLFGLDEFAIENKNPFFNLEKGQSMDDGKLSELLDYQNDNSELISTLGLLSGPKNYGNITESNRTKLETEFEDVYKLLENDDGSTDDSTVNGSEKNNKRNEFLFLNENKQNIASEYIYSEFLLADATPTTESHNMNARSIFDTSKEKDKRTMLNKTNHYKYSGQNEVRRNYLKKVDKSLELVTGKANDIPISQDLVSYQSTDESIRSTTEQSKPINLDKTTDSILIDKNRTKTKSNGQSIDSKRRYQRKNKKTASKISRNQMIMGSNEVDNNDIDIKGKGETRKKKSARWIGDHATQVLEKWYANHVDHPYPTREERIMLEKETKIAPFRINAWLSNKRNRNNNTLPKNRLKMFHDQFRKMLNELKEMITNASFTNFNNNDATPNTTINHNTSTSSSGISSMPDSSPTKSEGFDFSMDEKPTDPTTLIDRLIRMNDCLDYNHSSKTSSTIRDTSHHHNNLFRPTDTNYSVYSSDLFSNQKIIHTLNSNGETIHNISYQRSNE